MAERELRLLAHTLPLVLVVLMAYWMGHGLTAYGKTATGVVTSTHLAGFSWATGDGKVFNWHPLLMTVGFLFCSTQAALAYTSVPAGHETQKHIHATLHGVGLICAIVGIVAVFRFHNEHNITNLYSLHSWLGIFALVLFGLNYVAGFVTFLFPKAGASLRATAVPIHSGLGLGLLAVIFLTAATGILEKLSFNGSCNISGTLDGTPVSGFMAADCVLGNTLGLLVAITFMVVFLTIWHAKVTAAGAAVSDELRDETTPLIATGERQA